MFEIDIDCHLVDWLGLLNSVVLCNWLIASKIWWLVHIKPDTWKRYFLIQPIELFLPKFWRVGMQVINEMHFSWPYFSNVILSWVVHTFQKHVQSLTLVNAFPVQKRNSHINQRNPMKIFLFQQTLQYIWRISCLIDSKNCLLLHVIQIIPHGIQRQIVFFIIFDDRSEHIDVFIAPSALMPA